MLKSHPFVAWPLLVGVACFGLHALLVWQLDRGAWLNRTETVIVDQGPLLTTIRWTGGFYVPSSALYRFSLDGDGRAILAIDGATALERPSGDGDPAVSAAIQPRTVWLGAGFHSIDVEYDPTGPARDLPVTWGGADQPLVRLDASRVVSEMPRSAFRGRLERTRQALWVVAWVGTAGFVWFLLEMLARTLSLRLTGRMGPAGARIRRVVAIGLLGAVVAYAAVLRSEAMTATYGLVETPGWLREVQQATDSVAAALRPPGITYEPAPLYSHKDSPPTRYIGDPYTYLAYARQMTSFYAAHRREPVFPFATKVWLLVLNDQDVAVSFASASFSVLAVLAAYLLASSAFSRRVGIGVAMAMAIEEHLITGGISGERDEAFMFAVVMFAWALLRWRRSPSPWKALLIGALGGFACLIRITSVSFLAPGIACLLVITDRPWKARLRDAGLALSVAMLVAAPYVINCWIAFGDPLYAINVHANIYRETEGQSPDPSPSAAGYVGSKLLRRPLQTLDTAVWGLTAFPFLNKWSGFDAWSPTLGPGLSYAALLGLILFLATWPGRLLLVVLVGSLLPYAFTWQLGPGWRFTEHAYPFFLVAALVAIGQAGRWLAPASLARLKAPLRIAWRPLAAWLAVALAVGAGWWTVTDILPPLVVRESLGTGEDVTIAVSGRDTALIGDGWSAPVTDGNVTFRVATGSKAEVLLPLPEVRDYGVTMRLDPFPSPLAGASRDHSVDVFLNGTFVSRVGLHWTPGRVGTYDLRLPASAVRRGTNRLRFVTAMAGPPSPQGRLVPGVSEGTMVSLWYVRVRPGLHELHTVRRWS